MHAFACDMSVALAGGMLLGEPCSTQLGVHLPWSRGRASRILHGRHLWWWHHACTCHKDRKEEEVPNPLPRGGQRDAHGGMLVTQGRTWTLWRCPPWLDWRRILDDFVTTLQSHLDPTWCSQHHLASSALPFAPNLQMWVVHPIFQSLECARHQCL